MTEQVVVHKGRVTILPIGLGYDVSEDEFKSEIREEKNPTSTFIAEWEVTFETDGVDGELLLKIDDSARTIEQTTGYMDIKRVTGGEPVSVFDEPLEVSFRETITV